MCYIIYVREITSNFININIHTELVMNTFNLSAPVANIIDIKTVAYFERPAGSWAEIAGKILDGEDAAAMVSAAVFTEITEQVRESGAGFGLVRYFQAQLPSNVDGFEAAVTLQEFEEMGYTESDYEKVQGHHQEELQALTVRAQPVSYFSVAVGPNGNPMEDEFDLDSGVVYFWAPGRVLPPQGVVKLKR